MAAKERGEKICGTLRDIGARFAKTATRIGDDDTISLIMWGSFVPFPFSHPVVFGCESATL